ncbi:MAG: hypothetical protein FJ225_08160 [Lentisphaerae bacterium]|nr:hypothetical protein [Lentisphaerota bacterium]
MAEELQSLLERIRTEGVAKAEADAARIVAEAEKKAAGIVAAAEKQAAAHRAAAERDADAQAQRGRKALEQAARDVVLSVGESVNALLEAIVRRKVGEALNGDTLRHLLVKAVEAYACAGKEGGRLEVLLADEQRGEIADAFLGELSKELREGVRVTGDGSVVSGFRVSLAGGRIEHDFSADSIARALGALLRPALAEIVQSALKA